jgi:hypothetical protein
VCGDFVGARVDVPGDEQLVLSNENGKLAFTRAARVKKP